MPVSDSFKRNPLRLGGVSGVTIVEGDEADGDFGEPIPESAREGGELDPYEDFNSYHLSYLLGVKAGAKAAEDGNIGAETTDGGSGWETGRAAGGGYPRGGGAGGGSGAGGGGGGGGIGGDDVYWLGYKHGRQHGVPDDIDETLPFDLETGQPLSLEERIANLTRVANNTLERETYWDTPSSFEQIFIAACCLRGPFAILCCQRGCCCLNRDISDLCWVGICAFGSAIGFVIFLGIYFS